MKLTQKYWFKAKKYGWGWTPATWQAWLIIVIYICALVYRGITLKDAMLDEASFAKRYTLETLALTIPLLIVSYLTGEKPRWRWGN